MWGPVPPAWRVIVQLHLDVARPLSTLLTRFSTAGLLFEHDTPGVVTIPSTHIAHDVGVVIHPSAGVPRGSAAGNAQEVV